ncbi:MAG: M48 family metallopeptidase, partial [Gemmobacter sp.]
AAVARFRAVVDRVEPVAEAVCRVQAPQRNCDFQILVDLRPGLPINAFQTVDRAGRPVLIFTAAMLLDARSADELAFVLGHEAGHHIAGHLDRARDTAVATAIVAGVLAQAGGGSAEAVQVAQELGAAVGRRAFSQDFELEADAIGTLIAFRAGFDAERGAAVFTRLPDPGNRFLGTHPPNAARIDTVRATLARLRRG